MKKSKFTDEQIAFALKQAEVGTPVEEVCGKMGISDATDLPDFFGPLILGERPPVRWLINKIS